MFQHLPTASLTAADLLAGSFRFVVPAYQRPYCWTPDEAGQLLDDLIAASGIEDRDAAEPDYFVGALLLLDRSGRGLPADASDATERELEIVDGQQRLITASILAAVLRDMESAPESGLARRLDRFLALPSPVGAGRRRRLELQGKDRAFFDRYICNPRASIEMPIDDQDDGAGAHAMLDVREHFLSILGDMAADERRTLASYMCDRMHFVVILSHDVDRAHKFFSVLNDRGRPLQKGDILKAEILNGLSTDQGAAVIAAWEGASIALGSSFDRFFGHLKSIQGQSRPQVITAVRALVAEAPSPGRFVHDTLAPLADAYKLILDAGQGGIGLPLAMQRPIVYLSRLNGEEWAPAAMLAIRRHLKGAADGAALLSEIDRIAHLVRLLTLGKDKRARWLGAVAQAIKSGAALDASSPLFQLSRDEVRAIALNLRSLSRRSPPLCKLLLMRLSDEMAGGQLTRDDPAGLSVEHVLPQRPPAGSGWRTAFPDSDTRESATHSLGNLVLLPIKSNEAVRNFDFDRKRAVYQRCDLEAPSLTMIREVAAAHRWGPAEIRAREQRLLELVSKTFRIDVNLAPPAG